MRNRKTFVLVALLMVCFSASVTEAAAKPPPPEPSPTQCLEAFVDEDGDYVGEGWVDTRVEGPPSRGPLDFSDSTDRDFSLYCGNELSGVVHIGDPETAGTGSGHSITAETEEMFRTCWRRTIAYGERESQDDGRSRFVLEYGDGEYATAIVDDERRLTYTLFTDSPRGSDDWQKCVIIRA